MADQTTTIPKGWKMTTLGEVVEITSSKRIFADEYKKSGIPFFRGKEITEKFSGNEISTELFISDEKYEEIKNKYGVPEENDILLTSVGTLGNPYLVEKGLKFYFKDGNLTWFHNYKGIYPKFLYYWITSPQGKESLSYAKIGSTQEAYTIAKLKVLSCIIPPLPEQRAIAAVLSSLDDKIELLREQNKTLEAIAQAIFKEWFVKFNFPNSEGKPYKASGGTMIDSELGDIPEGWRVGRLTEIFDFMEGPGIRNWQYTETGRRFINIRLIQNSDIDIKNANFISLEEAEGVYKHFNLEEKDMVVSTSGTLGRSAIVRKEHLPLMLNTSVIRFRPIDRISYGFMYQFLNSRFFQNELLSMASGSVQLNFGPVHLKQIKMVIPNEKILQLYAKIANSLYIKISNNFSQIQTLSTLRDTLLPKLMKGEIRVKGFGE